MRHSPYCAAGGCCALFMAAMRALMASMLLAVLGAAAATLLVFELDRADTAGAAVAADAFAEPEAAANSAAGALFSSLRADLNRARMASIEDMDTA